MALTERYVTSDAVSTTWADSTNQATPVTLSTALSNAAAGDRVWIKAGTYTRTANDLFANNGTVGSPIEFEGYGTTPGDGYQGRTNQGALVTTNMPYINYDNGVNYNSFSGANIVLRSLRVRGTRANQPGLNMAGSAQSVVNCVLTYAGNGANSGLALNSNGVACNCDIYSTDATATGPALAGGSGCHISYCRITLAASGATVPCISADYGSVILNCQLRQNAGIGVEVVRMLTSTFTIAGCTFYGHGGAAVRTPNSAQTNYLVLVGNIITDSSRALLNQYNATAAHPLFWAFNRTRDNTSADLGFGDWPYHNAVTTDTGGPETDFVNAASGDLRLILASPAVSAGPLGGELGAIPRPKATLPTAGQVQSGVTFGYSQDGLTTGTQAVPAASDVRSGTAVGSTTGTLDLPLEADVQEAVTYDGASKTGTLELPTEAQVESGVGFGAGGTEFTGELVAGAGTAPPSRTLGSRRKYH